MVTELHQNGISYLKLTKGKHTFFTNGRDSKIKFFDIRGLGLNPKQSYGPNAEDLTHIYEFKDHNSENFNITPCLLENQRYVVTGSLDNLVSFKLLTVYNRVYIKPKYELR